LSTCSSANIVNFIRLTCIRMIAVYTRCLYQDRPVPVSPLSSRNARSTWSKRSFINLLLSSNKTDDEPWACCDSSSWPFDIHCPQPSQAQTGEWQLMTYKPDMLLLHEQPVRVPTTIKYLEVQPRGGPVYRKKKVWRQKIAKCTLSVHPQTSCALVITWRWVTIQKTWQNVTFDCCFIWRAADFRFEIADTSGLADTPRALHPASSICTPTA
jgi:hypothetical protein